MVALGYVRDTATTFATSTSVGTVTDYGTPTEPGDFLVLVLLSKTYGLSTTLTTGYTRSGDWTLAAQSAASTPYWVSVYVSGPGMDGATAANLSVKLTGTQPAAWGVNVSEWRLIGNVIDGSYAQPSPQVLKTLPVAAVVATAARQMAVSAGVGLASGAGPTSVALSNTFGTVQRLADIVPVSGTVGVSYAALSTATDQSLAFTATYAATVTQGNAAQALWTPTTYPDNPTMSVYHRTSRLVRSPARTVGQLWPR